MDSALPSKLPSRHRHCQLSAFLLDCLDDVSWGVLRNPRLLLHGDFPNRAGLWEKKWNYPGEQVRMLDDRSLSPLARLVEISTFFFG
jgi:hypothetical protein